VEFLNLKEKLLQHKLKNRKRMSKFLFSIILFVICFNYFGFSQSYRFKVYDSEKDGIYPYIYSLHQDSIGFLWIGTGEGLYRFDGHNFKSYNLDTISGNNFISSSLTDKNGNNWFGHDNGKITLINGLGVENINIPVKNPGAINSLVDGINGSVWAATQNVGICKITTNKKVQLYKKAFQGQQVYCMSFFKNNILVGTGNGLFLFNPLKPGVIAEIKGSPLSKIECIYFSKSDGIYYIGTEDAGIYSFSGTEIKEIYPELKLSEVAVKDIICESNGSLWIGTMGKGVINIPYSDNKESFQKPIIFNQSNGLNSLNIKKLFFDREENIWIGTYGNGLVTFLENFFTFILQNNDNDIPVFSVYSGNDCIWAGTNGKLIKLLPEQVNSPICYIKKDGIPNDKITSIYLDKDLILWLGTEKNGLYVFDIEKEKAKPYFISEDQLTNSISSIDGFGENIFVGTHNGLIIINKDKKTHQILTTVDGLPHNFINHIITDVNSNVWIATPTNYLCKYSQNGIEKIKISSADDLLKVNSLTFDTKGQLWLATYGNGVFVKTDSVFKNYSSANGLLSDYCYSIVSDETGTVWVGHRQGLSAIYQNSIKQFGKNRGVTSDCNLNANCIDNFGIMWVGTSDGILRYDFRKNSINRIPPTVIVTSVKFNEIEISDSSTIAMPYGKYKIKIDFAGITFKNPELVTYSYMLEGYDLDWSEPTFNTYVIFPRLEDGKYTLLIKAYNAHGISNIEPYKLTIIIDAPWWKKWWAILLFIIIFLYGFYIFIKIRERNHRIKEEILQKTLDERTSEVVAQKELIEQKNKDITDSINYAKRIQEAILPSPSKLHSVFPDSFVYYLPRDIVSGDFYVFYQTEDRFVVICADATGHGVPGAFMSLISSTILKDILQKKHVFSPSQILYELDKELQISLQSEENNQTTDGLDIAVCEFNLKTNEMSFSSAMRPLLLFRNNCLEYIRGSKFSIGASLHYVEKEFKEHHFKLNSGDCIYLFSDGFPDQFGGMHAKKLKISGFQKWISSVNSLTMKDQHIELQKLFNNWKGIQPQIDDILIIGIKYCNNK
jgi:ligand-binding sensor domain-containing protein/serine phosphatase RsbU (regulator of sigma subunit)